MLDSSALVRRKITSYFKISEDFFNMLQ